MTTNPMRPRRPARTNATAAFKAPTDNRVKITIRISEEMRRDLHIQARIDDTSVNELLIEMILAYLADGTRGRRA